MALISEQWEQIQRILNNLSYLLGIKINEWCASIEFVWNIITNFTNGWLDAEQSVN